MAFGDTLSRRVPFCAVTGRTAVTSSLCRAKKPSQSGMTLCVFTRSPRSSSLAPHATEPSRSSTWSKRFWKKKGPTSLNPATLTRSLGKPLPQVVASIFPWSVFTTPTFRNRFCAAWESSWGRSRYRSQTRPVENTSPLFTTDSNAPLFRVQSWPDSWEGGVSRIPIPSTSELMTRFSAPNLPTASPRARDSEFRIMPAYCFM